MPTLLRVGGIAGMLAGVLALALAPRAGLAVVVCVVAAGLAAGLGAAKWMPRAWYGRQLGAGLRAGLIACVFAVPATLVALLGAAPHDAASLAARTRIMASPLGSASGTGWEATDALAVVGAALVALVLAAISARVFAASKSARFVTAVARARDASQPLREEGLLAPALARRTIVPLPTGAPAGPRLLERQTASQMAAPQASPMPPSRRTLAPVTPPDGLAGNAGIAARRAADAPVSPPPLRRTIAPEPRPFPLEPDAELPTRPVPAPAHVPAPTPAPPPAANAAAPGAGAPPLKHRGAGRPSAARLTPEMIEALAAWARDTEESDEDDETRAKGDDAARSGQGESAKVPASRQPVESSYLNEPAPATPKRKRKKNATRDWIC